MMNTKTFLTMICLMASMVIHAQQYIITDKDGYTNIRKQPNTSSEVVGKVLKNQIFFDTYFVGLGVEVSPESNWLQISTDGNSIAGYIYRKNVFSLEKLPLIQGRNSQDGKYRRNIVCTNDTMQVILHTKPFDPKVHKIKEHTDYGIESIDGNRHFLGTEGMMPTTEIKEMEIICKGKKIIVPTDKLKHCYEPSSMMVYVAGQNELYVCLSGGDAAGGYGAWFSIIDGKIMHVVELTD